MKTPKSLLVGLRDALILFFHAYLTLGLKVRLFCSPLMVSRPNVKRALKHSSDPKLRDFAPTT